MDDDTVTSLSDLLVDGFPFLGNAPKDSSSGRRTKVKTSSLPGACEPQPSTPPIRIPVAPKPSVPAIPVDPPALSPVAKSLMPTVSEPPERDADERTLTEAAGPIYLMASSQPILPISCEPAGYFIYRERFLEGCGCPKDPLEILLIESLILAFHNAGRLIVLSAKAGDVDTNVAYADAAARLMAEFRRGALALQDFREKARNSQWEKSKADGRKKSKASRPKGRTSKKKSPNGKLASNGSGEMPPWLQKRFDFPTPGESRQADAIGCGGRG